MAGPRNTPTPKVVIEYDCKGSRVLSKVFSDAYAARRLYVAKLKQGKNPVVLKSEPPKTNS